MITSIYTSPRDFARDWAEAWNRRDVEAVLAQFSDAVTFTSPTALAVVGDAVVRGKPALRAYWMKAMGAIQTLVFTLDRILWDPGQRELAILYLAEINGARRRVSENLTFDASGRVVAAEVFHGAVF